MDLDEAADRLYGLPPESFTKARDALVAAARAAGDTALAKQIGVLRRPTVVAWLANQLAREHPDEIQALGELGASLRAATATLQGDELRALARQQHQVVAALVGQARAFAEASGRRVSLDMQRALEDTVLAALADPGAATSLAQGRLTEGLAPPTSFPAGVVGPGGASDSLASPGAPPVGRPRDGTDSSPSPQDQAEQRARQRARAETQVQRQAARHAEAVAALSAAQQAEQATALAVAEAQRDVDELSERLDSARRALADAEADEKAAGRRSEQAELAVEEAAQALAALQEHLSALTDADD